MKDLFNKTYGSFTPDWFELENKSKVENYLYENNKTLLEFIDDYLQNFNLIKRFGSGNVLESGCGFGGASLLLNDKCRSITGIDISELAIAGARTLAAQRDLNIQFKTFNVCANKSLNEKFDFIIDSHLLHCLTSFTDRKTYIDFIKSHLTKDGLFICESMVFQAGLEVPIGYSFDHENTLFKSIDGKETPIRKILSSIEIENELKSLGLKINYLYYHNELAFEVFDDFKNYPFDYLPKTLRFVCSLDS